jgi:hypothetical protein
MDANERIDLEDAITSAALVTSAYVFSLACIYILAYFRIIEMGILGEIKFIFVGFTVLITFNLMFCYKITDQLLHNT